MTNRELITRFKDMADLADAAYAKLHYVYENIDSIFPSKKWEEADDIMFGDKTKENDRYIIDNSEIRINSNTAYARAIEARFCKEMLNAENKQIKSIKDISLQAKLSHRTKNFVNRYELVHHIPNTLSGFSATIFRDLGEFNIATDTRNFENDFLYIIAFRGTESIRI